MHVTGIATYPVKGCHRVEVDRAAVEPWGLVGDRRWLIVDRATGVAVTQRDAVTLTRIFPTITADGLLLRTAARSDLLVPYPGASALLEVKVWRFTGPARPAGPATDEWLSATLQRDVRLVWFDDPTRRRVNPDFGTEPVSFADGYPVSLASSASLDALNDLIRQADPDGDAIPITRFRPNVVVSGGPAWAEDTWTGGRIRIGEVIFRVPKPIDRCLVTTIDQETGEKGREPLRALGRHRNVEQDLLFATNLIPETLGTIAVGDPVAPL